MGLIDWFRRDTSATEKRASIEDPKVALSANNVLAALGYNTSGIAVTRQSALSVPAVWSAVQFLANTIASLPLHNMKREKENASIVSNPMNTMLNEFVNESLTSFQWRHMIMHDLALEGRHVSLIMRRANGQIGALYPLESDRLRIRLTYPNGLRRKKYIYDQGDSRNPITYDESDVLDLVWMYEADGYTHVRPYVRLAHAIRLNLALQEYADRFFSNGAVPPYALFGGFDGVGAAKRAADDLVQGMVNAARDGSPVIGMPANHELKELGVNPEQSQFIEARRFAVEEVARIYQMSPVFLQDLTNGTFNNTEQSDIQVTKHTVRPWITRIEAELNLKLYSRPNTKKHFAKFDLDGLLRGDFQTRMRGITEAVKNGVLMPDEGRELLDRGPKAGGGFLYMQGQMKKLTDDPDPEPQPVPTALDPNADEEQTEEPDEETPNDDDQDEDQQ